MGNKVLGYSGRFFKLLKVLLTAAWSLMLLFIVYFTMAMWRPYNLHCMPKLNKSDLLADWCTDAWPDVYRSVESRFVSTLGGAGGANGFDEGGPYEIYLTIAMLIVTGFIVWESVKANWIALATFGIFSSPPAAAAQQPKDNQATATIFSNLALVPQVIFMCIGLAIWGRAGGSELARVLGTMPLYYWASASFILEFRDKGAAEKSFIAVAPNQ